MNRLSIISFLFLFALGSTYGQAQSSLLDNLSSDDSKVAIEAAKSLGRQKDATAIKPLLKAAESHPDYKVRSAAAAALGNMETKPEITSGLKKVVESDANNAVVYAALVAIFNQKDFSNKDSIKAVEYCEKNKMDDAFIKDIITKIRKAM